MWLMLLVRVSILVLIVLLVIILFGGKEGLRWDRGFAGFRPAVSDEINLGSMDIPGDKIGEVALSDKVIMKIVETTAKRISKDMGISVVPLETVFIEAYGSAESMDSVKKERPDVYASYIKYLEEKDKGVIYDENKPEIRAALISYLDTIKKSDVARVPDGVPLTYRARIMLLEVKRYYGIEVDVIAMGDDKGVKIVGVTTKTKEDEGKIQAFVDDLKAGEWMPWSDLKVAIGKNKSILDMANEAIDNKLKR